MEFHKCFNISISTYLNARRNINTNLKNANIECSIAQLRKEGEINCYKCFCKYTFDDMYRFGFYSMTNIKRFGKY